MNLTVCFPEGLKKLQKRWKIDARDAQATSWREVGSPWGTRAGPGPEQPAIPHFEPACFEAIFRHFGIIFVFVFQAIFQHGFGIVLS